MINVKDVSAWRQPRSTDCLKVNCNMHNWVEPCSAWTWTRSSACMFFMPNLQSSKKAVCKMELTTAWSLAPDVDTRRTNLLSQHTQEQLQRYSPQYCHCLHGYCTTWFSQLTIISEWVTEQNLWTTKSALAYIVGQTIGQRSHIWSS